MTRLRRCAGGSIEEVVIGPQSPDEVSGLWARYISADLSPGLGEADPVDTFPDTSGNNRDLSQADSDKQPTIFFNVFDTINGAATSGDVFYDGTEYLARDTALPDLCTVFLVYLPDLRASGSYIFSTVEAGTGGTSLTPRVGVVYAAAGAIQVKNTVTTANIGTITADEVHCVAVRIKPLEMQGWLDGVAGTAGVFVPAAGSNDRFVVGCDAISEFLEVAIFNRALTDQEMENVNEYLIDYYVIGV